jgi:hypothetical protein
LATSKPDATRQSLDLSVEACETDEERASELRLDRAIAPQQAAGRSPMASRDEVRDRPTVAGRQREQMRVESVAGARGLGHQILAGLEEQSELTRPIRQPDRRQVRLPRGHAGDRKRVARIALARTTGPLALGPAQVRRDLTNGESGAQHRPRERRPER